MKFAWIAGVCLALAASQGRGQRTVTIPLPDGPGQVQADLYGEGTRGIVLAHGGQFHKESWKTQAETLARAGFVVAAVSFRGDRLNPNGSPGSFGTDEENTEDVLAAAAYLRRIGAKTISAVGASMGGDAVGDAEARSGPGVFDRIVILGSSGGDAPGKLSGRKLFIVARDDRNSDGLRLPEISRHFAQAPEPKKLVILEGSAHAQFLFATDQGQRLMNEILRFLSEP
jgi:dienelactone hydrolase